MKKSKKKSLIATSLSAMILCGSTGLSSIAYAQIDESQITNVTDYRSSINVDKDSLKPGFTISPDINTDSSEIISVIIELKEEPLAIAKLSNKKSSGVEIKEEHKKFKDDIKKVVPQKKGDKSNLEIGNEFLYAFNGITIDVAANKLPEIAKMPQVKTIWNNKEVKLPESEMPKEKAGPEDGIKQIGVDRLHDEGLNGEGIKVGVLDTGIDYNHPQLKDVYKGGYDFINNDDDPMETTYDDWKQSGSSENINGSNYYTSHGTHVSGTIAANGDAGSAKGVAPNVDLYGYKVLGPYGTGTSESILAGIDKAVADGMDIINLSLGASINDSLFPTSVAINNAAKAGVIPVVAAGNSGPTEYTLGSPGTSPLAITVGASDTNLTVPTFNGSIESKNIDSKLLATSYEYDLNALKGKSFEMVECGLGKPQDFANKDLKGKIAVIKRGDITLNDKIMNAKKAGAELVFLYNNVDGHLNLYLEEGYNFIPTFDLTKADGEELLKDIENNKNYTFNNMSSEIRMGDKLADFSSRGPVGNNFEIKPDVVAPGVNIYSTYPEYINHPGGGIDYDNAYAKISGTSMATPHVAGVVALMLDNAKDNGEKMSVEDVKVALMNTSEELNGDYNVYEKGAGRVNAYNAVKDPISIEINNKTNTVEGDKVVEIDNITGSLQFGSTYQGENSKKRTIKITNNSKEDKEFNISFKHASVTESIKDSSKNGVELEMPKTIKVPAGKSINIDTSIKIPDTAEKGFYEGTLVLTNNKNDKEDYVIPYAIRYSEKGISGFDLTRYSISDDPDYYHEFYNPTLGYQVRYNSPMKSQKLYLKDAESGKRIGLIREYEQLNVVPDKTYLDFPAFDGRYLPMVGDHVENRVIRADEGHYKLELEVKDNDGNVYTDEKDVFVDNTPPEVILDKGEYSGTFEVSESDYTVENGDKAFYVKGKFYDNTIDKLKELGYTHDMFGYPLTQQTSTMLYYQHTPNNRQPWYSGNLNIDTDGRFNMGITPEEIAKTPTEVSLFGYDYATAGDFNREQFASYIKEGDPYGDITYEKDKVFKGDTQTGHVNFTNLKDVKELEFVVGFSNKVYDLESMTINPEFEKYAESNGLKVELSHEPTKDFATEDVRGEAHKVVLKVSGSDKGIDINEKMPVIDIKAKVVNDDEQFAYNHVFYTRTNSKNKYKDSKGATNQLYIMSFVNQYKFIPKTTNSSLQYISAQGFFDEKGWSKRLDYTKMDAKAYVITPDGKRHDATIDANGYATVNVPTSIEEGDFYVEVPGHFKNKVQIKLGKMFDEDVVGTMRTDKILTAYAGDMNGDNIIDKKDEKIIKIDMGKTTTEKENYLASDLNKDRVVDKNDLAYITENMGMVNPRLMEDAEVAMARLIEAENKENLNKAVEKVDLLPECKEKKEFTKKLKSYRDKFEQSKK